MPPRSRRVRRRSPSSAASGRNELGFLRGLVAAVDLGDRRYVVAAIGRTLEVHDAAAAHFDDDVGSADRTRLGNDAVPRHEVALGIVRAPVKRAALLGSPF